MDFEVSAKFSKQLRKLRVPRNFEEELFGAFQTMTPEEASNTPYYLAGRYRIYKKFRKNWRH